jgi:hypothetical protein
MPLSGETPGLDACDPSRGAAGVPCRFASARQTDDPALIKAGHARRQLGIAPGVPCLSKNWPLDLEICGDFKNLDTPDGGPRAAPSHCDKSNRRDRLVALETVTPSAAAVGLFGQLFGTQCQ